METINRITDSKYLVIIDTKIYSKTAITATLYKFSEDWYINEAID
jgi:hypothetical protein